jgi:glutamyl-tRNA synthetase
VVRGDDLVASTARQILLWRVLAADATTGLPFYGHVPLVVGPDGARIAKRHGDARLRSLRGQGVDPRLILGVLAAMSGLGDDRPRSLADLAHDFDWSRVNRDRVILDETKLSRLQP